MPKDPIVAEVRKAREAYAKRFGYDLHRICADLRKSEKRRLAATSKPIIAPKPRAKAAAANKPRAAKRRKAA